MTIFLLVTGLFSSGAAPSAGATTRPSPEQARRASSIRDHRRPAVTGDDYPVAWQGENVNAFATVFGWNRQCVSFAAWRLYTSSGGRSVPTGRAAPADWARYSINVAEWGDAGDWARYAASHGVRADHTPTVGSIAHWNAGREMRVGHVGVVKAVHGDGSIEIEQYNLREDGRYSVLRMPRNAAARDQSNGHGLWIVPWPDHFIHIRGR